MLRDVRMASLLFDSILVNRYLASLIRHADMKGRTLNVTSCNTKKKQLAFRVSEQVVHVNKLASTVAEEGWKLEIS